MTTIIRRHRRHRLAPLVFVGAATILLVALVAWVMLALWTRGGPQPVHEIVIALPAPRLAPPNLAASSGPRA